MDDFFSKPPRRHIREINLVPIIDMFTTVIFFLLLSTSFIVLTKLTIPPSRVSTITDPIVPPPLSPKLILVHLDPSHYRILLSWAGKEPGETSEIFNVLEQGSIKEFTEHGKKMVSEFVKKYPAEKSIQLGLGGDVSYQAMISVMDGIREVTPDIVLISSEEAEARSKGIAPEGKT